MVRIKPVKSGNNTYYYIVKDEYDSFSKRSTTKIVRKATPEEVEEYKKSLPKNKSKKGFKYQIRLYLKSKELKIHQFNDYKELKEKIDEILKEPDSIKEIKIKFT